MIRGLRAVEASARVMRAAGSSRTASEPARLMRSRGRRSGPVAALSVETPAAAAAAAAAAEPKAQTWRASIDYKAIRDDVEAVKANCERRNAAADPDLVVTLYEQYLKEKLELDAVLKSRNDNAKSMKQKLSPEERTALIEEGKALKEQAATLEETLAVTEAKLQAEGQKIPNATHPDVPTGGEEEATLLKEAGAPREFDFPVRDHTAIGDMLGLFDFEAASRVSGSRFVYLKGAGALLELALINWTMQKVAAKGFMPYMTPDLVRQPMMEKCGFQPRAENTQVYSVVDSDLCLTGTAEIPLGGLYSDQVVTEADLPLRMSAFGHCFRTEAGAAGAATRGLYRLHQFSKVELFVLATPEQSDEIHKELIALEEELFEELGFHFKTLDMPTQDLGAPAYRKFDVEAWMPGLGRYGEISSASNCTDFQSRRLNIKYRPNTPAGEKKKPPLRFVHTLNATACAVPRMLICILENFQQEDGSVKVPAPLVPFVGKEVLEPDNVK